MALKIRKLETDIAFAIAAEWNKRNNDAAVAGSKFHADVLSVMTSGQFDAPTATQDLIAAADGAGTLAALRTLAIDIYRVYILHLADSLAHKVADPPPALVAPTAADSLGTIETFLNAVKADFNTHRASTTYHYTADSTAVASADATDQASSDTLANEIKSRLNTHIASAPSAAKLSLVAP